MQATFVILLAFWLAARQNASSPQRRACMNEGSGKARGGHARAKKLSAQERSAIASKGGKARHQPPLPRATHKGMLKVVADLQIACFVLDDGRRVISGRGMTAAIGMKGRGQGIARIAGHR